ncbi:stalk domain-containing protein [Paenibacillus herberti]|uniref:Copper amine oxidase n=1 Tax=Paenibacillus herberti TaxID=1619309 RepID=A0A229NWI2_9BACL|nr:DUF4163 domain-containing protein [Paenibacillus herberti]OXM14231.1 copper amine oxidase [Paenibacillus herberti]
MNYWNPHPTAIHGSLPRKLLLSLVGAALIGTAILPAQSQSVSAAGQTSGGTAVAAADKSTGLKVSTKTITHSKESLKAVLNIPVISGMKDTNYQKQLNKTLENNAIKGLESMRKQAEKVLAQSKKDGDPFQKNELKLQFSANFGSSLTEGGFLSLKLHTYSYAGGAHGISNIETYTIANGAKASRITLKTLFGEAFASTMNKEIKRQIKADPERYFQDAFTGVQEDQTFYIAGDKVRVVFQPYEITPYATGIPEFEFPLPKADKSNTPSFSVKVNGKLLSGVNIEQSTEGVAMIPVRLTAEALGYSTVWDAASSTLELKKDDAWTSLTKGNDSYSYNKSAPVSLGVAPVVDKQGRLTVPLAFFTEILKASVDYNGDEINLQT